ncbi:hypothetical protein [Pseudomonas quasicaspiana]|uniref:hypothetical protein n=1 Tax=Pseudomonas quasicaspiana TaxID=2829821 RepID=UPI001E5ECCD7|nr:hypothetical protein [Pseudomonas quasicaspiana]MCD5979404.1 hypothetical protein [Pseudomonas quasicaspiana]
MKTVKASTLGVALFISLPLYMPAYAADAGDTKVEQCVDVLRAADSSYEGVTYILNYRYSQIWLLDKSVSDNFSACISQASGQSPSNITVINSRDSVDIDMYASMGKRYLLSDAYQRKILVDTTEKRSYELVRTPPSGSIEALGGNNPNTYDRKCVRPQFCPPER